MRSHHTFITKWSCIWMNFIISWLPTKPILNYLQGLHISQPWIFLYWVYYNQHLGPSITIDTWRPNEVDHRGPCRNWPWYSPKAWQEIGLSVWHCRSHLVCCWSYNMSAWHVFFSVLEIFEWIFTLGNFWK